MISMSEEASTNPLLAYNAPKRVPASPQSTRPNFPPPTNYAFSASSTEQQNQKRQSKAPSLCPEDSENGVVDSSFEEDEFDDVPNPRPAIVTQTTTTSLRTTTANSFDNADESSQSGYSCATQSTKRTRSRHSKRRSNRTDDEDVEREVSESDDTRVGRMERTTQRRVVCMDAGRVFFLSIGEAS